MTSKPAHPDVYRKDRSLAGLISRPKSVTLQSSGSVLKYLLLFMHITMRVATQHATKMKTEATANATAKTRVSMMMKKRFSASNLLRIERAWFEYS